MMGRLGPSTRLPGGSVAHDALTLLAERIALEIRALCEGDPLREDEMRSRLVARLTADKRRAAQRRRALNARKFVAQRGCCATCGDTLRATVMRRPHVLRPEEPIVCPTCFGRLAESDPRAVPAASTG
jgi:hypothetical protein